MTGNRLIQDAYEILEEVGQGGMARVFRARQLSLNRVVAIKEIKTAFAGNPELLERFKREARTAANLIHENIIQVYNFGEPSRGSLFIVMEFMEGRDLKSLLRQSGAMPPRVAAILVREAARALAYAHTRKLVHRDVKPGNIMVSDRGEVKLMDFGIVREMDSELTRTGAFLGTPSYMSPEQFLGEETTPASDVFSLGVVLFELLTAEKPFKADSEASLSKKVRTESEPAIRSLNGKVPRRLAKIAHQCLRKAPLKRVESTERLVQDLEKFLRTRSREDECREVALWMRELSGAGKDPDVSAGPVPQRRGPILDSQPDGPAPEPAPAQRIEIRRPARGLEPESAPEPMARPLPRIERRPEPEPEPQPRVRIERPRTPDPEPPAREASEMKARHRQRPPETGAAGEWMMKWLWRLILLTIVVLTAAAIFMIFNPDWLSQPGGLDFKPLLDKIKLWIH